MDQNDPHSPPAPPTPNCPHCRQPLATVGWNVNPEFQLVTIYHNDPGCMTALNLQFLMPLEQQRRIHLPSEFQPIGRG